MYREFPAYVDSVIDFNIIDRTPPSLNFTPEGVYSLGDYSYLACGYNGLHIFNIFNPTNPVWVSMIDTAGFAREVVINGNYAYVSDYTAGVQIVDVYPPSQAHIVENIPTQNWVSDVYVNNNLMYTAEPGVGVRIIQLW